MGVDSFTELLKVVNSTEKRKMLRALHKSGKLQGVICGSSDSEEVLKRVDQYLEDLDNAEKREAEAKG